MYKKIDSDMSNLIKNFRVDFMKELKSKRTNLIKKDDFSDNESESQKGQIRQITPLSVPTYTH